MTDDRANLVAQVERMATAIPVMLPQRVILATIDADYYWTRLTDGQRQDIRELIVGHGHNYTHVQSITYDVVDTPYLRITEYLCDEEDGRRYAVDDDGHRMHPNPKQFVVLKPATRDHEVALRTPLPGWWTPEVS